MKLKVVFSTDATGHAQDITEVVSIKSEICLYCLHDRQNRFYDEVKKQIENKGYDLRYYFELMKVYTI